MCYAVLEVHIFTRATHSFAQQECSYSFMLQRFVVQYFKTAKIKLKVILIQENVFLEFPKSVHLRIEFCSTIPLYFRCFILTHTYTHIHIPKRRI